MGFDTNEVRISGHIVDGPSFAKTKGDVDVSNFTLDVQRSEGVSDYIFCTAFGDVAKKVQKHNGGDHIKVTGWITNHKVLRRDGDWYRRTEIRVTKVEGI